MGQIHEVNIACSTLQCKKTTTLKTEMLLQDLI